MNAFSQGLESLRLFLAGVPGLSPLASAPYLFRPLVMLVVLAIVGAAVGILVNLRSAEFHAEALVHAVFPGIVIGAISGGIDTVIPAACAAGALAAGILTLISHRSRREASEAGTAVVLTGFFSVGLILLLRTGDRSGQLEALTFGRLLEVTDLRLAQALVVCGAALLLVSATWKEQVYRAFDGVGARTSGQRVLLLDLVLNMSIAAVVVSAATAVGTLLVIGFLTIPGTTARLLAKDVAGMLWIAVGTGLGGGYSGMLLAAMPLPRPVSPQACVVMVMAAALATAALISARRRRRG
ncbi:metal ABC transporter permease [Actinomyces sp.]|uniref:metal ABC transporter permease n=1 Tax=Actinomyces sp. TaxID=29317 RepID=UPI0026DD0D3D|nr:metal ABC transporter permease [Actinomyces sp.]MDO4899267.1 metal ABC transporter permease [Actinomyces sp.]